MAGARQGPWRGRVAAEHDPRQGGCFYCQHVEPKRMCCTHPGYPVPTPFYEARDDVERCGPRGAWWAPRLELTAPSPHD